MYHLDIKGQDTKGQSEVTPNRRFILYSLDFPSWMLADCLVHARLRRSMAWFSSGKIHSGPDTLAVRSTEGLGLGTRVALDMVAILGFAKLERD
jgi:hypothetical protein